MRGIREVVSSSSPDLSGADLFNAYSFLSLDADDSISRRVRLLLRSVFRVFLARRRTEP
jgi:hypothetical protein